MEGSRRRGIGLDSLSRLQMSRRRLRKDGSRLTSSMHLFPVGSVTIFTIWTLCTKHQHPLFTSAPSHTHIQITI